MAIINQINEPEVEIEQLAAIFKGLSDPSRLRILNLLAQTGEICNCQIESVTGYGHSKISRHFNYLKQVGLIQSRREGLWIHYSIKPMQDEIYQFIYKWLDQMVELYPIFKEDIEILKTSKQNNPDMKCG